MKGELRFNSIIELAQWIDNTRQCPESGNYSHTPADDDRWDLGLDWQGTIDIAHDGGYWKKGSTLMQAGMAEAAALTNMSTQPTIAHSVAGFMPDVPAYLAGVPENMLDLANEGIATQQPIVSVAIPNSLGGVPAEHLMNRGVAIVTLVDLLEGSGTRCEVFAGLGCSEAGDSLDATVCVKKAENPWSPATMAFGIAHPTMYRRLGFAVRERHAASVRSTRGGYGDSTIVNPKQYTLVMPRLTGQDGWSSVKEALATVEGMAKDAGLNVTLAIRSKS